jgi:predicted oxidoreductase
VSADEWERRTRRAGSLADFFAASPLRGSGVTCLDLGMQPMIWSPLAGGRLFDLTSLRAERVRSVMQNLALAYGISLPTMSFAWILAHPLRPVPIAGSQRISAMREAFAALDVRLTREDWFRIWSASAGRDVA